MIVKFLTFFSFSSQLLDFFQGIQRRALGGNLQVQMDCFGESNFVELTFNVDVVTNNLNPKYKWHGDFQFCSNFSA